MNNNNNDDSNNKENKINKDANDNNNTNETLLATSSEEQKRLESEALAKETAAEQKASKTFEHLTSKASTEQELGGGAGEELKQTVRLLVMAENTDALSAVLTRLNGDKQAWEVAQREPVALIAMIIEEQQKRMAELQKKLQQEKITAVVE